MQVQEKFESWAIVELFGHTKIAGSNMLRVDVPETKTQPPFTRFFGASAIYSINPTDEETATYFANSINVKPVETYEMSAVIRKQVALLTEASKPPEPIHDIEMEEKENNDRFEDNEDDFVPPPLAPPDYLPF